MARTDNFAKKTGEADVSTRDILFECPSCGKSLVVDETAEGMIVDCPQCHINVIVPPRVPPATAAAPGKPAATESAAAAMTPPAEKVGAVDVATLHRRLDQISSQIKELQTQWTEVTSRLTSRINEVNRDLVGLARLETSHKQILKEWNQVVGEIAAASKDGVPNVPERPAK
jgi:DNA-directed RNA polymerase subunit RPC12/RpoP